MAPPYPGSIGACSQHELTGEHLGAFTSGRPQLGDRLTEALDPTLDGFLEFLRDLLLVFGTKRLERYHGTAALLERHLNVGCGFRRFSLRLHPVNGKRG